METAKASTIDTSRKTNLAFKIFRASGAVAWEHPMKSATKFASTLARHQIINISHSSDNGCGTVVVWYEEMPA